MLPALNLPASLLDLLMVLRPCFTAQLRATGVTGSIFSQTLPFGGPFQLYVDSEQALDATL